MVEWGNDRQEQEGLRMGTLFLIGMIKIPKLIVSKGAQMVGWS